MGFLCVCVRRRTPECVHRCKATPCVRAPFVCDDGTRLLFVFLFSSEHSRLGNSFFFSVSLSSARGARCGRCVTDTFFFFPSPALPCFFPSPPPTLNQPHLLLSLQWHLFTRTCCSFAYLCPDSCFFFFPVLTLPFFPDDTCTVIIIIIIIIIIAGHHGHAPFSPPFWNCVFVVVVVDDAALLALRAVSISLSG